MDGRDAELSNSDESIARWQQVSKQSINPPSCIAETAKTGSFPSSTGSSNTSTKHSWIHDGIRSRISTSNSSNESENVIREVLPKPLPELESGIRITPPPVVQENDLEVKSPEALSLLDFSEKDHTPPLMKVSLPVSGTRPQSVCPAPRLEDRGEREGGNEPVAPELRRLARLRPEATSHAQEAVRQQSRAEQRFFSKEEREHRLAVAKFRFYWESEEPVLMREAQEWASANPDALPEALPLAEAATIYREPLPLKVGDAVAHADPYMVAYTYHGIIEHLVQGSAVVRWAERSGKPLECETYELCELRRIEEVPETLL